MEGAGEGMVAILQGTKHAGLMVTLVPDNRLRTKRKCVLMDLGVRPPTRITQSSVETNTERVFKNACEPMSYATSYQFGNCKAVQSSFHVSEFPHHSTFYRRSDQFAESLRKYPVQASSEILQRIINYTNIKQNSRKQNIRSIRSLLRKSTSQQMHRRYESGVNTNNETFERRPLNKSISTIGSRYASQKELLSNTYDYLQCISLIPRSTNVRYLTQVKRCIRNRLLDIIDDRPAVCPRIRSRYSHHKKHFHGPVTKSVSNENETHESCETAKYRHLSCRYPSFSRRKLNFCHQRYKCDCTPTINKQNPLESLMRKLYPELDVNKKQILSKQKFSEPKIQISGEFKTEPRDGFDNKMMTAVSEWLKSIPVYPNFSANDKMKQEELAFKLAENLSALKNHVDFISKAKGEIMLCIKDLPMWYPPYLSDKEQFIDQIVTDLLKRLVNVLEDELRYKVAQAISNLPYTENVDTEKIVDDFVYKMKTIVLQPPEDERDYMHALKPRILDLLNKLPIQCSIQKINDVADKLVDQLLGLQFTKSLGEDSVTVKENALRENILKWCKNAPELGNINFIQNMDLINELADKFKYYESRGHIDESVQAELVKSILVWLEDAANTANLRLNSKIKNRLGNKMANHFFGKDFNNTLNDRKSSEMSTSQEALEPLLKWYYGIQELADGERADTRKAIDRLAKELNEIQSRDYNFENMLTDMKEVVTVWLQNMLKKRDKHLDSKVLDNFVNKLISELNVIPKPKKQRLSGEYGQFYRDILSWLKNIPYLKPESYLNQTKVIEKLVHDLNNIRKGSDVEYTLFEAVTKFIQSLSNNLQVHINEEDIQILKDKLFERLKHTFKQRKRWDKVNDLCQAILPEFTNILQAYSDVLGDANLNNINNKFCRKFIENVESENVENGMPAWNYLIRQLDNILMQETNLPKNECEDLANSILTRLKRMFPQEITRRSTILSQPVKAYVEPTRIIEQNSKATTKKHRTHKHINDSESASGKNKSKRKHYRKINLQAGDGRKNRKRSKMSTIYKSSNSDLDTHDSVDYYENSENRNDHSGLDKHEDKLKTSTPLSAAIKHFPTALDVESTIGSVTRDTQKTLSHDSELSRHLQYFMELKNVITDWVKSIDLNSNNSDIDNVVDSIASDIIDRQKYLQLSETKYSENDELEHLKYQIFRKLNKLKKYNVLPHVMSKINSLHRLIKNISVPDLINQVNESHIPKTSESYNSIFNGISHWLDGVSSNLLKSSNTRNNRTLINELIENLKHVQMTKQYDYEIEKYILLWLQNVLKKCNDKIYHELAEDLKSNLQDNAPKTTNLLKQDENILEAIVEWLQNAPFCKKCTKEERDMHEKLALLLATNLVNILQATRNEGDNLKDQLIEEVQKYLKTIPIPKEFRNNIYYYKAAGELIEHLKKMITKVKEICDGINNIPTIYADTNTQHDFIHYNDLVKIILKNWCDNLPIHLGHSYESKEEANKLKQYIERGLLEKLSYINLKEPNNDIDFENLLSDEIHKIFNNVPINRELERSLPILNSILIEKLKQAKIQTQSLVPKKILHDTLTETLQEIENTPDLVRASLDLLKEKLADAFINLHYHESTDYEFREKLKDKLYNEINKFCNAYLERYPFSPMASDELRFNLHAILKKVPLPDTQQVDISDESSKLSFEKEIILRNATTQYSSPQFLPSRLSNEDRDHLEIIRKRVAGYPKTTNFERPYKDWSPQLKDTGVQTDCKEKVEENVQTSKTLLSDTISHSKDILPQVVIKEFYWDSSGSKQSLQMFVPPALTSHNIKHRKKDTKNSQNQTETNAINKSTKAETSQKLPYTVKVSLNNVDKATDATSKDNNEKQEYLNKTFVNSPIQESHNNQNIILPKDSSHRQQQTEKPFHQYHKRRTTYPDSVFDNGVLERYIIQQPRNLDDHRYIRNESRPYNYLEDLVADGDRRILTQRIFLTPENRNKDNTCCAQNTNPNWRNEGSCRRRCTLKHCSKCYGGYCPHPSMAFFKKNF